VDRSIILPKEFVTVAAETMPKESEEEPKEKQEQQKMKGTQLSRFVCIGLFLSAG